MDARCLCLSTPLFACIDMASSGHDGVADPEAKGCEQHASSEDESRCALDIKVQQLSVYASQRRLCITAAVANSVQEVEEGLLLLARPKTKSIAAEIAPAPKVYLLPTISAID